MIHSLLFILWGDAMQSTHWLCKDWTQSFKGSEKAKTEPRAIVFSLSGGTTYSKDKKVWREEEVVDGELWWRTITYTEEKIGLRGAVHVSNKKHDPPSM